MAEQVKILAENEMQITSLKELQIGSSPVQELWNPDEFGILLLPKSQTVTVPEHQDQFLTRKSPTNGALWWKKAIHPNWRLSTNLTTSLRVECKNRRGTIDINSWKPLWKSSTRMESNQRRWKKFMKVLFKQYRNVLMEETVFAAQEFSHIIPRGWISTWLHLMTGMNLLDHIWERCKPQCVGVQVQNVPMFYQESSNCSQTNEKEFQESKQKPYWLLLHINGCHRAVTGVIYDLRYIVSYHPEIQSERRRILSVSHKMFTSWWPYSTCSGGEVLPLECALVAVQLIGGVKKGLSLLMELTNLIKE